MRRGSHLTDAHKEKLRQSNLGKKATSEAKANMSAAQLGRKFSLEHRARISEAQLGRKVSAETRAKIRAGRLGIKNTPEARRKISEANRRHWKKNPMPTGPAHPLWRGGDTKYGPGFTEDLRRIVRWLYDDCCVLCDMLAEEVGPNELSVHHIDYDKKNNMIDNLVPLCASCHSQTNARRDYWQDLLQGRIQECA